MVNNQSEELLFAAECAKRAGTLILEYYGKKHQRTYKLRTDFSIEVDNKSDRLLRSLLHGRYPNDSISSEEIPYHVGNSGRTWVVDPLDGTFMYTTGTGDQFGIAIALALDNEPVLGVNYFPKRGELYTAEKGRGATCNNNRLQVSDLTDLPKAIMGINHGKNNRKRLIPYLNKLWSEGGVTVCMLFACASAPLSFTAAGMLDAYFAIGLEPWDMAAAVPIIREAGGRVTNIEGEEWRTHHDTILAANHHLHSKLLEFFV